MISSIRTSSIRSAKLLSAPSLRSTSAPFSSSAVAREHIHDADETVFENRVLQAPKGRLVVVDFKAVWCGPCKVLGPLLEKVIPKDGDIDLVTVDVDDQPGIAQQFGIRAMPTVVALRDGDVVSQFKGAIPEPQIRQFLDSVKQ